MADSDGGPRSDADDAPTVGSDDPMADTDGTPAVDSDEAPTTGSDRAPWRLVGLGGVASLCCIGSSAVGGAALATGAVAGGLGADFVQVLVTMLTVGVLGLAWSWRRSRRTCERD